MYCTKCGTENKPDAAFCWKCGKSFSDLPFHQEESQKWEFCEIVATNRPPQGFSEAIEQIVDGLFDTKVNSLYFEARVTGPKGPYIAAEFKLRPLMLLAEKEAIVAQTISQLAKEGWAVVAKGKEIYAYQLRRPVP